MKGYEFYCFELVDLKNGDFEWRRIPLLNPKFSKERTSISVQDPKTGENFRLKSTVDIFEYLFDDTICMRKVENRLIPLEIFKYLPRDDEIVVKNERYLQLLRIQRENYIRELKELHNFAEQLLGKKHSEFLSTIEEKIKSEEENRRSRLPVF